jgi:hypothetical protein
MLNPAGAAGLSSILFEGPWRMTGCYFDSCPTGGVVGGVGGPTVIGANIVHKSITIGILTGQTVLTGCHFVQNASASNPPMIIENGTDAAGVQSLSIIGGDAKTPVSAYSGLVLLPNGPNTGFIVDGLFITTGSIALSGGVPVIYAPASASTVSGSIKGQYDTGTTKVLFGIGTVTPSYLSVDSGTLATGANVLTSLTLNPGVYQITGSVLACNVTTNVEWDVYAVVASGTATILGCAASDKPSATGAGAATSIPISGTVVVSATAVIDLNAYVPNVSDGAVAKAATVTGAARPYATGISAVQVA